MKKRIYKVKSDVYRPDGTKEVHFCGRFNTENETTEGILRKLKWAEQKGNKVDYERYTIDNELGHHVLSIVSQYV